MISQVVSKYLRIAAESSHFWGIARFYFRSDENRLFVPNSSWRKFFTYFNFCSYICYSTFLLVRLLQIRYLNDHEKDEQSELFLEYFGLLFLIPPSCCHMCFFRREKAFATFVNQFLMYYRNIEGKVSNAVHILD